ncbi:MAG: hypothetical protein JW982_04250 [Spirochaetes bacterium]|nr:hypothetical protein [Spirochaetota bacterium]
MKKFFIITALLLITVNCEKKVEKDLVLENFTSIKDEIAQIGQYGTDDQLKNLFFNCMMFCNDADFDSKLNDLASAGFSENKWDEFNAYIKNFTPVIKVVVTEDAVYMSPDTGYFLQKSEPDSVSQKFFTLAEEGWYDSDLSSLQLGKEIWPVWLDGETGKFLPKKGKDSVKKWEKLKSDLDDIYFEVADRTITELNNEIDLANQKSNG